MKLRRIKNIVAISLMVLLGLSILPGAALAKSSKSNNSKALGFSDWQEAGWALEYMLRMRLTGIINGYEDGTFRPNQPVSQAEAVAMLARAMGLESKAQEYKGKEWSPSLFRSRRPIIPPGQMKKMDPNQLEKAVAQIIEQLAAMCSNNWAEGYVKLAIEKEWLYADEIEPGKPAQRAWVAMLLVRAMDMEDEAEALSGKRLNFKDAGAIPADLRGYVAVSVEEGIFTGDEKNLFRPKDPVTRAEMAALIDRMLDAIDEIDDTDEDDIIDDDWKLSGYRVLGEVASVGRSTITIKVKDGTKIKYDVSADALVFVAGKEANLNEIEPRDAIKIILNGDGVAILLSANPGEEKQPEKVIISGTITSLVLNKTNPDKSKITIEDKSGRKYTFEVIKDVVIELETGDDDEDPEDWELRDLEPGDKVTLKAKDQKVYEIILRLESDS